MHYEAKSCFGLANPMQNDNLNQIASLVRQTGKVDLPILYHSSQSCCSHPFLSLSCYAAPLPSDLPASNQNVPSLFQFVTLFTLCPFPAAAAPLIQIISSFGEHSSHC